MDKVSPEVLAEVRRAFSEYKHLVEASPALTDAQKVGHVHRAELFLFWLDGRYDPRQGPR